MRRFFAFLTTCLLVVTSLTAYEIELAVATIFRDDAPYLVEWIEFHRLVGVERFYLYNNYSQDNFEEVLQPYIDEGVVELYDRSQPGWSFQQCQAYTDAIERSKGKAKWLALIDTDEFIVPVQDDDVPSVLSRYEEYGGLCVNWVQFGSSHVVRIPEGKLMIELLTMRGPLHHPENHLIKSIVRPERVEKVMMAHQCTYKAPYEAVGEEGTVIRGHISRRVHVDVVRLNHYWTRDEDFFRRVKLPRRRRWKRSDEASWKRYRWLNHEEDSCILRFVEPLRERVDKRR